MAITTLTQGGYVPWNKTKFHVIPTIADMSAPTALELGTGFDVTPQLTAVDGLSKDGSTVESQSFVGPALKFTGPQTLVDSALTFRDTQASAADVRQALDEGDEKFVVRYPEGTDGDFLDVFKVEVTAAVLSSDPGQAATVQMKLALIEQPQFRVAVP